MLLLCLSKEYLCALSVKYAWFLAGVKIFDIKQMTKKRTYVTINSGVVGSGSGSPFAKMSTF